MTGTAVRVEGCSVDPSPDALADLRERLARTRWCDDELPDCGWDYGINSRYLKEMCEYWQTEFNWTAATQWMTAGEHVSATIDGARIHAMVARSHHPGAIPLLLVHGWPGSILEFAHVVDPLVNPQPIGGSTPQAFHVVCPSLPGYTWSGPTKQAGWDIARVADAFAELMPALGFERFVAQGGDWGGLATAHLAARHPHRLIGIHLNLVPVRYPDSPDEAELTPEEQARLGSFAAFQREETGYSAIQGTKPQTLSYGLNDSPAGLAAWILEKFHTWSDNRDGTSAITRDLLLANITAYWVTGTAGSAARLYYESMHKGSYGFPESTECIEVRTAVADFPGELLRPPRRWAEACYNIVRWTEMPRGGHFAALEQPALFVDDLRTAITAMR
jgi:pimeloyl-ACP methyl ester carboxylesterase